MMLTYSVDFFESCETKYNLSEDVIKSIEVLKESLGPIEKRNEKKMRRINSNSDNNWESMRNFKATEFGKTEIQDKPKNDLRNILNKISKTNLDDNIEKAKEILKDQDDENIRKSIQLILKMSCANNFYSDLYAKIFKSTMYLSSIFKEELHYLIENYKSGLQSIQYVEPNENYDEYCNYNKNNDLQKSKLLFLINLLKEEILNNENIVELEKCIFDSIEKNTITENRKNEVEELIENLFVFYSNVTNEFIKDKEDAMIKIRNLYSNKEKSVSLSSRGKFRCMDIIDLINKL